jgi:integrase
LTPGSYAPQTFSLLKFLTNFLHHTLELTCAATALLSSEILALRWAEIRWEEEPIRVSNRWVKGKDRETKAEASDGYGSLHPVLAHYLQQWHRQTPHMKDTDFGFPSWDARGRGPTSTHLENGRCV